MVPGTTKRRQTTGVTSSNSIFNWQDSLILVSTAH
jgi:hypothetical protein